MTITRTQLSAWNRKRKEVGEVIGAIGTTIFMTPVLLVIIATPFIWLLDSYWIMMEWQPSDAHVWTDSANYAITQGPFAIPYFAVFGSGIVIFLLGFVVGVGRRVR
jgi:hypothetical protein